MTKQSHTPTPWAIDGFNGDNLIYHGNERVCVEIADANAEHIVRCVNSYDRLVAALRGLDLTCARDSDNLDSCRCAGCNARALLAEVDK
jgi:hypothetical protein